MGDRSLTPEVSTDPETHAAFALRPTGDGRSRWFRPDALSNPDHVKFALKGCLAATFCYMFYGRDARDAEGAGDSVTASKPMRRAPAR